MRATAAILAALLATGSVHADVAEDFSAAYLEIYGDGPADLRRSMVRGLSVLDTIDGNWFRTDQLAASPLYDRTRVAEACAGFFTRIERDGALGFVTRTVVGGEAQSDVTRFQFSGGPYFGALVDLEGAFERLFPDAEIEATNPGELVGQIIRPDRHALVRVSFAGPDVLVLESVSGHAQILTRCPNS